MWDNVNENYLFLLAYNKLFEAARAQIAIQVTFYSSNKSID